MNTKKGILSVIYLLFCKDLTMAKKQSRFTQEDLNNILKNNTSLKVREEKKKKILSVINDLKDDDKTEKKKKKGTDVNVIINSLKNSIINTSYSTEKDKEYLCIWFTGARVLTLNQIFAILEKRPYEIFKYKKVWQECINNAIMSIPAHKRPYFYKNTRMTLFRRGTRLVDMDSFQTVFKYCIDALRYSGILSEDNPNIISEIIPIQQKGYTSVGIMLESIKEKENIEQEDIYKKWFKSEEPIEDKNNK